MQTCYKACMADIFIFIIRFLQYFNTYQVRNIDTKLKVELISKSID